MTAIVKVDAIQAQAQSLDIALRAASALKNARGLLPESLKNEGEIVAVLLAGQELGLPPMASLRGLQIVRGKVIISYDTMIALLRRASYRIEWLTTTATEATLKLSAPDGTSHVETWTAERAKKAGLWGTATWAKYPDTMLRARCVSSAARSFAGEVLAGVYLEESGEREEIAAPVVRVIDASPPAREPAQNIEDAIIEAEAVAEPAPVRSPPPKSGPLLRDCKGAVELGDWIRQHGAEVLRRGEKSIAKVAEAAAQLDITAEDEHGEISARAWVERELAKLVAA